MGDMLVLDELLIYRDIQLNYLYLMDRTTMVGTHTFGTKGDLLVYDVVYSSPALKEYSVMFCTKNNTIANNYCQTLRVNGTISRVSATIMAEYPLGSFWVDSIKYRGEYAALV